jgi:hypothetical protein
MDSKALERVRWLVMVHMLMSRISPFEMQLISISHLVGLFKLLWSLPFVLCSLLLYVAEFISNSSVPFTFFSVAVNVILYIWN